MNIPKLCEHWKKEGRWLTFSEERQLWLVNGKQEPGIETVDDAGELVVIFACDVCSGRLSVRHRGEPGTEGQDYAEV